MSPLRATQLLLMALLSIVAATTSANGEVFSVGGFAQAPPKSGIAQISGCIAKQYECPACPPEVNCKPCMGSNVLLSDRSEVLKSYPDEGNYVVVFTENPRKLSLGKCYLLTVEITDRKTTSYNVQDLRLKNAVEGGTPAERPPGVR